MKPLQIPDFITGSKVEIIPHGRESGLVKIYLPKLDSFCGNDQIGRQMAELEIETIGGYAGFRKKVGECPRDPSGALVLSVTSELSKFRGLRFIDNEGGREWPMLVQDSVLILKP